LEHGDEVRLAGMISGVRIMTIKNGRNAGRKMARFQLEDLERSIPVVVFARTFEEVKDQLVDDSIVFVTGRVDKKEDEAGILLDSIVPASSAIAREVAAIVVHLDAEQTTESVMDAIESSVEHHKGEQRLVLEVRDGDTVHQIRTNPRFRISIGDELLDELSLAVGPQNLSFVRR
ncbi:MAG: hypothetical protein KDB80_18360, partial [Planctomycetes bacterium]|nr:hypothetical protein [Planctomycetota bacterium]